MATDDGYTYFIYNVRGVGCASIVKEWFHSSGCIPIGNVVQTFSSDDINVRILDDDGDLLTDFCENNNYVCEYLHEE